MSDYKVEMINDGMQEFYVDFNGPKESKSSEPIYDIPPFLFIVFMCLLGWIWANFDVISGGFYPCYVLKLCSFMLIMWKLFWVSDLYCFG